VVLSRPRSIVGRSAGCDLRLTDTTVSAFHCELSAADERNGILVSDLSSRNGTLYAGARLDKAIVPSGATLEVGGTIARIELDAAFETHVADLHAFGELRGRNVAMRELFSTLQRLGRTDLSHPPGGPDRHRQGARRAWPARQLGLHERALRRARLHGHPQHPRRERALRP
jgi:hypothetical protein